MQDLEVKARLCMPSMPNTTPFYIETSVTKVNRKAWPIMEGCGDHRKNSGKGRLVTDGNGQPQTGVEKKGLLRKTASRRLPLTEGNGKKIGKLTCHGSQRTVVAKKTTENLRTENRKKKYYGKKFTEKNPSGHL